MTTSFLLPTLDPAELQPRIGELVSHNGWTRTALLELQQRRLAQVLRQAATSAYYRDSLSVVREPSLADLPILTKRLLMDNWDTVVTDRRLRLREVEEHLASDRAGTLIHDQYRAYATGGTTGERAVVVYNQAGWVECVASMLRLLGVLGVGPATRTLGIGAPTPLHITNRAFAELSGGRSDAPRLSVVTPAAEMIAALNAYQPEVVFTYPSIIVRLAEQQQAGLLDIRPTRFVATGEVLTPPVRQAAREAFGTPVLSAYGTTEAGLLGTECDQAAGIHLAEDEVVLEAVDEDGRPVPPGTPSARILVTTLYDSPLPLIRYEISDVVTLSDEPCPCGLPYRRVVSLDGRREDILTLRGRSGAPVRLHAGRLRAPLAAVAGLRQFQVVRRADDDLCVRICPRDGADPDTVAAGTRQIVERELQAAQISLTTLEIRIVEAIERSGTGAKERLVATA
jgi:phenylacetate-CoA ligase